MGYRYIRLSAEFVVEMLRGNGALAGDRMVRCIETDLPADAKIVHAQWDFASNEVVLGVGSETWIPVESTPPTERLLARQEMVPILLLDSARFSPEQQHLPSVRGWLASFDMASTPNPGITPIGVQAIT